MKRKLAGIGLSAALLMGCEAPAPEQPPRPEQSKQLGCAVVSMTVADGELRATLRVTRLDVNLVTLGVSMGKELHVLAANVEQPTVVGADEKEVQAHRQVVLPNQATGQATVWASAQDYFPDPQTVATSVSCAPYRRVHFEQGVPQSVLPLPTKS